METFAKTTDKRLCMPGTERLELEVSTDESDTDCSQEVGTDDESEVDSLELQAEEMEMSYDAHAKYYCVVSTAPAEKQWCVSLVT